MKPNFIPDDVEVEILVRLPGKSILRFRSVCKRWNSITRQPSFISRYNQLSGSRLFCFGKYYIPGITTLTKPISSSSEDYNLQFPPFVDDNRWVFKGADIDDLLPGCGDDEVQTCVSDIHIVGPVNGIYCIFHRLIPILGGTLILWNPATRSYKHILPPVSFPFPLDLHRGICAYSDDDVCEPKGFHLGFGYDDDIDQHKVVVICHWNTPYKYPPDELWHVRVYNNANDSWTTICCLEYRHSCFGVAFPYIVSEQPFCNSFTHGACHWSCAKRDEDSGKVLAFGVLTFGMVDHSFKVMAGPPIPLNKINPNFIDTNMSVWVFKQTIAVLAMSLERQNIQVWIMNQYGVEDSWNLLVSIATQTLDPEFHVLGIPNDDRIFLGDDKGRLVSYGLDDDQVEEHDGVQFKPLNSYNGTLGVFNYVESLSTIKPPRAVPGAGH